MTTTIENSTITRDSGELPSSYISLADLLHRLGDVPLDRIRTYPPLGTATEADVERIASQEKRYCELVDGVLVEKTVGFPESLLASIIIRILGTWVADRKLGIVLAPDGLLRLVRGTVRGADVSFISASRLPGGRAPREQLPLLVPDLAIEILSPTNTKNEMLRKRQDYFNAGTRLVWEIDLQSRTVAVYTTPETCTVLQKDQSLVGGNVLPEFSLSLKDLFNEFTVAFFLGGDTLNVGFCGGAERGIGPNAVERDITEAVEEIGEADIGTRQFTTVSCDSRVFNRSGHKNLGMDKVRAILTKFPVKTRLSLNGTLIVARDVAHARLKQMLDAGKPMPDYFKQFPIYYAGPAKTPPGMPSGSFGPTTAGRMDSYMDQFQAAGGSLISLAKGNRSQAVTDACKKHGGFYLGSIGGPAAILAQNNIKKVELVDFEDLGMEAIRKIEVVDFPAFIVVDDKGNDFFVGLT